MLLLIYITNLFEIEFTIYNWITIISSSFYHRKLFRLALFLMVLLFTQLFIQLFSFLFMAYQYFYYFLALR